MSQTKKSTNEWERIWKEYSKVLEKWRETFNIFQNVTMEMQQKYNEVMEKAANDSNKDTMKQFGENWQKTISQSGIESFKSYEEMLNKFTETWKSMWPKQ